MEKKFCLKHAIDDLEEDKKRLMAILDRLENTNGTGSINQRLINNLSSMSFEDHNTEFAVELLILVVSNVETQKHMDLKNIHIEVIKIINHNLRFGELVDDCFENTITSKTSDSSTFINILKSFLPNNKLSNIFWWISVVTLIVYFLVLADVDLTLTVIKMILNKI